MRFPAAFVSRTALSLALALPALRAETASSEPRAQLEVAAVHFAFANAPDSSSRWLEISVDVRVQPSTGNFVDFPQIELALATRAPAAKKLRAYRASVTAVCAERGTARYRFYLPPEIVRRDALDSDVDFWRVSVRAGDVPQRTSAAASSTSLRDGAALKRFDELLATAAAQNDGLLLPQHLTPFASAYPNSTPTILRRNGQ